MECIQGAKLAGQNYYETTNKNKQQPPPHTHTHTKQKSGLLVRTTSTSWRSRQQNPMGFNIANWKVLQLGQTNYIHQKRLRTSWLGTGRATLQKRVWKSQQMSRGLHISSTHLWYRWPTTAKPEGITPSIWHLEGHICMRCPVLGVPGQRRWQIRGKPAERH